MEIEVPYDELNQVGRSFQNLVNEPSERSAIIVLSARIESLTETACSHLLPGIAFSSQQRRLEGLRGIGVLDDSVFQILGELTDIRNYFAHSYDECSLQDSEIKEKVRNVLGIGNAAFGSKGSLLKMEARLSAQLPAVGMKVKPGWFTSDLNHIFMIFTGLALYLLALAYLPVTRPPKLDVHKFRVKSIQSSANG
jgi:hypothetical protein